MSLDNGIAISDRPVDLVSMASSSSQQPTSSSNGAGGLINTPAVAFHEPIGMLSASAAEKKCLKGKKAVNFQVPTCFCTAKLPAAAVEVQWGVGRRRLGQKSSETVTQHMLLCNFPCRTARSCRWN